MVAPHESLGRAGQFTFTDDKYTGDRVYDVYGAASEYAAAQSALTQFQVDAGGSTLHGSPISTISVDEGDVKDHYLVKFNFKPNEILAPQQEGDGPRTEFEYNDESERVYWSISTTSYGNMINYANAIGAKRNANYRLVVEGADMPSQGLNFSKRIVTASSIVTNSFVTGLASLVGKVNDASFFGFDAKEVLFKGVSGSTKSATEFELNFRFTARPNLTSYNVAGISVDADGWDIIEPLFDEDEDTTNGIWVPIIDTVFVHQVRHEADLSNLPLSA